MNWFQAVLALCLAGTLSPVMIAAELDGATEPTTPGTSEENRSLPLETDNDVVDHVMSLVEDRVAEMVAEQLNPTAPTNSFPNKGAPGIFPFSTRFPLGMRPTQGGVSKIHYYRTGVICSGVHLKPWVILTTGDCLIGRDVTKLYATVIVYDPYSNTYESVPVQAESVTMDPNYEYGNPTNNLALLQIYGRFDWDVEEFILPRTNFTSSELIRKGIDTFVQEWEMQDDETAILFSTRRRITEDSEICGGLKFGEAHAFCVLNSGGRDTYTVEDIGTPFYYRPNSVKRCLGIYMGQNMNRPVRGHLFQPFYSSIDWIDEYLHQHPIPPMPE